jgi:ABC-type ATPase involved in cell division
MGGAFLASIIVFQRRITDVKRRELMIFSRTSGRIFQDFSIFRKDFGLKPLLPLHIFDLTLDKVMYLSSHAVVKSQERGRKDGKAEEVKRQESGEDQVSYY